MHTLGQPFSRSEILDFLAQSALLGSGRWTGLPDYLASARGRKAPPGRGNGAREAELKEWISAHVLGGEPLGDGEETPLGRELVEEGRSLAAGLGAEGELEALLRGLAGGYIPAGPGGDLYRNPEVLPTGRNMYQFDPRRVPSPSATERGREMVRNILAAWGREGEYPSSVAVVLWGLETAKTQGETVAQILAYLGLELSRDPTLWEPALRVVPLEELGRPRIDVTVQMCGFFRDMFPNLVNLLAEAFELAAGLDEPESDNLVRARARVLERELLAAGRDPARARELASARLFGPTPSRYGTALTDLVKAKSWRAEGDLVSSYLDSLCHVYTQKDYGREMPGLLRDNLKRVELVSQVRSSMDYEITDLDHYYEFLGGLSRTVQEASGKRPRIMVSDTTTGKTRTEDVRDSIQRGVRTRLLNPKWLEAMLKHKHHGGQQISSRLENLVGLAATTGRVDNEIFDHVTDDLVLDERRRRQIAENNPFALAEVVERLLEARSRGYWKADQERLEALRKAFLEIEAELEEESGEWIGDD